MEENIKSLKSGQFWVLLINMACLMINSICFALSASVGLWPLAFLSLLALGYSIYIILGSLELSYQIGRLEELKDLMEIKKEIEAKHEGVTK